jgi:nucleotide-binding universal stress UspA family protein
MFKTVVWATDGSASADRALGLARSLAHERHGDLHIVHIAEKLATGGMAGPDAVVDERSVEAAIRAQAAQLVTDGVPCTLHMNDAGAGHIVKRIAEIADQAGADVIVVGTRGHSPIVGAIVGSVTQGLLHTARCPVLAVPASWAPQPADDSEIAVVPA